MLNALSFVPCVPCSLLSALCSVLHAHNDDDDGDNDDDDNDDDYDDDNDDDDEYGLSMVAK